jgi:hypothetical protein
MARDCYSRRSSLPLIKERILGSYDMHIALDIAINA